MGIIHYCNLQAHRPDVLMQQVIRGSKDIMKTLENTKRYLESDDARKYLGWEIASPRDLEAIEMAWKIAQKKGTKEEQLETKNAYKLAQQYKNKNKNPIRLALKIAQREGSEYEQKFTKAAWNNINKPQDGIWLQLVEPKGIPGNFDSNFKLFLAEGTNEICTMLVKCPHCKEEKINRVLYPSEAFAKEQLPEDGEFTIAKCPHNNDGWHITPELNKSKNTSSKPIRILEQDTELEQIKVESLPTQSLISLKPDTYQINCQITALKKLQSIPTRVHLPLLKLFERSGFSKWGSVDRNSPVKKWYVLTDEKREGNKEQRRWVEKAINTPDFAFLEGPPGSGKTTAICELVLQLALQGKRILLSASTHVAVDNVLERIMDERNEYKDNIIPLRIGDAKAISDSIKPWCIKNFVRTERKRILDYLTPINPRSKSQDFLYTQLQHGDELISQLILDTANLICGTTIGILQHPDIKRDRESSKPKFDVLIIDEASKTTFQEFLVPAMLAKKWILVGDPKQLSPYVEDEYIAVNIKPYLAKEYERNACLDVFLASQGHEEKRVTTLVNSYDPKVKEYYKQQADSLKVLLGTDASNPRELLLSSVVIGNENFIKENADSLPLDIENIRSDKPLYNVVTRRLQAYQRLYKDKHGKNKQTNLTWEGEVAWRLTRDYELRLDESIDTNVIQEDLELSYIFDNNDDEKLINRKKKNKKSSSEKLKAAIGELLPVHDPTERTKNGIDVVRRVLLPSVLEALQKGFERSKNQRDGTALSDGLPSYVYQDRAELLTNQQRMHPDIATFAHEYIYHKKALVSPEYMYEKREWSYKEDRPRFVWNDITGKKSKDNSNKEEVEAMLKELIDFQKWAERNQQHDEDNNIIAWEVALLTFYRGQERALRKAFLAINKNRFYYGDKESPYLKIKICTVDRFQGQEADLVLLSFTNNYASSFLESPNRLNVAITRAKYQLVVYGNKNAMKKSIGILGDFADTENWELSL